jgi:hypothetical protein
MFALVVMLALASSNTADVLVPVGPVTRVSGGECGPATDHFINGSRSQFDPLGRGVWLIDDENDEVLLLELVRDSTFAATTPRAAADPTATGLPRNDGSSRCSTDA